MLDKVHRRPEFCANQILVMLVEKLQILVENPILVLVVKPEVSGFKAVTATAFAPGVTLEPDQRQDLLSNYPLALR